MKDESDSEHAPLQALRRAVEQLHAEKVRLEDELRQTTRERSELAARAQTAQERFMDIVEFLPDATFVIDRDKRVIAWNRACEVLTGVEKEALLGQGDYAYAEPFYGERRPILIDLLDLPQPEIEARYKYVRHQGDVMFAESFVPRLRGGEGAHLWGEARPFFDRAGQRWGAIEVIRDVTDQKRIEQALRASEREYRELVMLANSIILRWSPEGRITFLNEFGQRFFGYTSEEIVGRHVLDTIVPSSETTGRDLHTLMEAICADPKSFERNINENARRNGERVWIDWTNKVVLDPQGGIREILSIGSDITDRKQAQEELVRYRDHLEEQVRERTRELALAKERAESADRLKSAFLATMSHELRTPLNSIIGFSGILLQGLAGPLNAEQSKQLGMLQNSSEHLLALINDVLDLSKIEAGQLQVDIAPFDLRASIDRALEAVRPQAVRKGLTLEVDIDQGVSTLESDRRRVEQILLNLLSNAIKFTDQGHVHVEVKCEEHRVAVRVSDTGLGIRDEELGQLFRPFSQLDAGINKRHEGTGLGLSICKRLVELLGGEIWVTSEWGRGSTFGFELPYEHGVHT
ncbi:MAG: PAS domain S-box protein [Polyangiaceae bacterium]|nr:PAS domain S-box protein [Polyangiaceae bacterium]